MSSACNLCTIAAIPVNHRRQLPGKGVRDAFTHRGSLLLAAAQTSQSPRLGSPAWPCAAERLLSISRLGKSDSKVSLAHSRDGPAKGARIAIPSTCPGPSHRENAQQQAVPSLRSHCFHAIPSSFQGTGREGGHLPCSAEIKPLTSLQGLGLCLWNSNYLFIKLSQPFQEALQPSRRTRTVYTGFCGEISAADKPLATAALNTCWTLIVGLFTVLLRICATG